MQEEQFIPGDSSLIPGGAPDRANAEIQRSRVEDSLQRIQKMEVVGSFAGGIVHDLNNILTVIVGCSQLLLEQPQLGQLAGHRIQQILDAGYRATKLTSQLLEQGRRVAQPVTLNLNRVVTDSEAMIRSLIGNKIDLKTELAADLCDVSADPSQMKQVLLNFCLNAREAMPEGGTIRIACENVTIKDSEPASQGFPLRPGRYVRLSVTDNGIGMDEQTLAQIYDLFFSSKAAYCQRGLAAVHYIVKHGGGGVWAESQPHKGSCFSVYLPASGEPATTQKMNGELEQMRGKETLLLVGTPAALQPFLPELLKNLGYSVLEAENAEQAQQLIERHKDTSALLIDIGLSGTSGLHLAASLRRTHPKVKTLQMVAPASGFVNHPQPAEGSDFVRKPFTPAVLARKLRLLLDGEKRTA